MGFFVSSSSFSFSCSSRVFLRLLSLLLSYLVEEDQVVNLLLHLSLGPFLFFVVVVGVEVLLREREEKKKGERKKVGRESFAAAAAIEGD